MTRLTSHGTSHRCFQTNLYKFNDPACTMEVAESKARVYIESSWDQSMATTHARFRAPDASAFQLAATLEKYEEHVIAETTCRRLLDEGGMVARDLQRLRCYCAELPVLAVPWMAFLISLWELIGACAAQCDPRNPADSRVDESLRAHLSCVAALIRRCKTLMVTKPRVQEV